MDTFIKHLFQTLRDNDSHISESALARKLGLLQYSLNRSISTGSVRLSVFLRALSLMGYTLEIKKGGKRWLSSGRKTTYRWTGKSRMINESAFSQGAFYHGVGKSLIYKSAPLPLPNMG